ncbi:hemolysin secretion protein D, chromosomal [Methylobacterium phyllosphaerae]|uniref:Membrane fusion protein (MFP) family protein n=2 Tax=Methylobacterium TaxID=407 RepID=A0AAE8L8Y3_9HYPH|nr:HlyD family type I secretion periplasmic adaptor subunit [Methylobacterium phyllosphaerae]APT30167.1 hemolysin secretion protein D, chromosomal [Methylobacterium phyllosphaerae]SFH51474.1 type I secretion membrane fusion protein, HlyD family [Methylobacterium phyllosphaerae]
MSNSLTSWFNFRIRRLSPAEADVGPVLLEFQSPTAALLAMPVQPAARSMLGMVLTLVIASGLILATCPVDVVVTGGGRMVSTSPTIVLQPLETSIVRSIKVREGQVVRAGELLAELDPTFTGADARALENQVLSLQAEVDRLTAESTGSPFHPSSADAATVIQVALYGQRQAQYRHQIESYDQKIRGLETQLARADLDAKAFGERAEIAGILESKRLQLERLQVGSQMNRLVAQDQRIEMQRNLKDATASAGRARNDLNQMIAERDAFSQHWKSQISQEITLRRRSLNEAQEGLRKATLRRQLVNLVAEQDAIVLNVAKVSVGSILQSGEQLITLVPRDTPLEVETRIAADEAGYVHPGQKVSVKFDTFPFVQYGMADGVVKSVSADSFTGQQETQRSSVGGQAANGVWFRARVELTAIKLHGLPDNFHMTAGMPVTTDVMVGDRTMLKYLFARLLPVGLEGMREP